MTSTTASRTWWFRPAVLYTVLGALTLGYILLTLFAPIDPHTKTYGLHRTSLRGLELTIVLPIVAVWFVALWGSIRFKMYALSIGQSRDGQALGLVADGLIALVYSLALTTLVQTILSGLLRRHHPQFAAITNHYLSLFLPLAAFAVIAAGADRLSRLIGRRGFQQTQIITLVTVAVMGVAFAILLVHDPNRQTSPNPAEVTAYYLPDWMILLTLVLPYLVQWYLGVRAALLVGDYQRYAPGIIYRQALAKLGVGLGAIIVSLVLIQLLTALGPSLSHLGLTSILALIYALVVIYAIGHILVAWGAKQLARIEEAGS